MVIEYREAQKKDCSIVAEYICNASDGLPDYLFEDIIPGMTVTQLLTNAMFVHKEFRCRGIGSTLISLAKSKLNPWAS